MRLPVIFLAIATVSVLAACGGSSSGTLSSPTNTTITPSPTVEVTPTPFVPLPTNTPSPPPTPEVGTRANPAPIGRTLNTTDGWSITVLSTIPDATAQVMAENQFNSPPAAGTQFFIATVQATYTGATSATFDASYGLRAVGASNVGYSSFTNQCGVIPTEFPQSEQFPGGVVQGNVCWAIKSSDAASLEMYYAPISAKSQVYMALH